MTDHIVLIVEDDKSLGTALSDTLELAGMQTIHVTDGQAALNILASQVFSRWSPRKTANRVPVAA